MTQRFATEPCGLFHYRVGKLAPSQALDDEHLGRSPRPSDPLAPFQTRYRNEADYDPARETALRGGASGYLDYIVLGNRLP